MGVQRMVEKTVVPWSFTMVWPKWTGLEPLREVFQRFSRWRFGIGASSVTSGISDLESSIQRSEEGNI
jgi:hypothetical protein